MKILYRLLYAIARHEYGPVRSHFMVWKTMYQTRRKFIYYMTDYKLRKSREKYFHDIT